MLRLHICVFVGLGDHQLLTRSRRGRHEASRLVRCWSLMCSCSAFVPAHMAIGLHVVCFVFVCAHESGRGRRGGRARRACEYAEGTIAATIRPSTHKSTINIYVCVSCVRSGGVHRRSVGGGGSKWSSRRPPEGLEGSRKPPFAFGEGGQT